MKGSSKGIDVSKSKLMIKHSYRVYLFPRCAMSDDTSIE